MWASRGHDVSQELVPASPKAGAGNGVPARMGLLRGYHLDPCRPPPSPARTTHRPSLIPHRDIGIGRQSVLGGFSEGSRARACTWPAQGSWLLENQPEHKLLDLDHITSLIPGFAGRLPKQGKTCSRPPKSASGPEWEPEK